MRSVEYTRPRQPRTAGDTWAERLARRQLPEAVTPATPAAKLLLDAIAGLWELFDQARVQANEALERLGAPARISMGREGNERRYGLVDPEGGSRTITVFINASVAHEHIFGGVAISNSQTRQPISLVPVLEPTAVRWQVASLGIWFDEDLVHNLFLSVFADDPIATARLSPLSGLDTFETPWS